MGIQNSVFVSAQADLYKIKLMSAAFGLLARGSFIQISKKGWEIGKLGHGQINIHCTCSLPLSWNHKSHLLSGAWVKLDHKAQFPAIKMRRCGCWLKCIFDDLTNGRRSWSEIQLYVMRPLHLVRKVRRQLLGDESVRISYFTWEWSPAGFELTSLWLSSPGSSAWQMLNTFDSFNRLLPGRSRLGFPSPLPFCFFSSWPPALSNFFLVVFVFLFFLFFSGQPYQRLFDRSSVVFSSSLVSPVKVLLGCVCLPVPVPIFYSPSPSRPYQSLLWSFFCCSFFFSSQRYVCMVAFFFFLMSFFSCRCKSVLSFPIWLFFHLFLSIKLSLWGPSRCCLSFSLIFQSFNQFLWVLY